MNIKPLEDRVLVQSDKVKDKTDSGIFIPGAQEARVVYGTIIQVGPGKIDEKGVLISIPVKEGDRVIYDRSEGTKVKDGDNEYLLLKFESLLAVVENN